MAGNQKPKFGHKIDAQEVKQRVSNKNRNIFMGITAALAMSLASGCGGGKKAPEKVSATPVPEPVPGYLVKVPIDCGPIDSPTTTPTTRVYESTDEYGRPITKEVRQECVYGPPTTEANYGNDNTDDTGYGDDTTGDTGGSGGTTPAYPWQGTATVGVGGNYALPVSPFSLTLEAIGPTTITFSGKGAVYSREVTPSATLFFNIATDTTNTFEVKLSPNGGSIDFSWRTTDTPSANSEVFNYPTEETNIADGGAAIIGDYYFTASILPDGSGGKALHYETRAATDMSLIAEGVVPQEGTIYGEETALGREPIAYVNSVNDALDNAAVVPFYSMIPVTSAGTRTTETTQQQLLGNPITTETGYRREVTDDGAYLVYYNEFSTSISNDVDGVPVTNTAITFQDPQGNTWIVEAYDPVSNTITASRVLATGIIQQGESITATVETDAGNAEVKAKLVDVRDGLQVYDVYIDGVKQEVQSFGDGDSVTMNVYGTPVTLSTRAALQEGQVPADSAQVALTTEERLFVEDTQTPDGSVLRTVRDENERIVAVEFWKKE